MNSPSFNTQLSMETVTLRSSFLHQTPGKRKKRHMMIGLSSANRSNFKAIKKKFIHVGTTVNVLLLKAGAQSFTATFCFYLQMFKTSVHITVTHEPQQQTLLTGLNN